VELWSALAVVRDALSSTHVVAYLLPQELVGQLDEAQVRAAMRASVKLKGSQAVAMGEDGMYELTAAYDKVRKRL
tara:strand:+ start:275 stop:499 length:225 start_codon:yes stop_codon:yes gene_type:complete